MNKLFLYTTKETVIYTALNERTVTVNFWNTNEDKISEDALVPGFNVKRGDEFIYNDVVMANGSVGENPDTVLEIPLKAGQSIYAWCSKENTVEYQIVE